ncbi:MAG TPA: SLBB domain-containing protein [Terriglobales bacterium]|nr:SLBB domain-containing protein [Terriglobales bacterium]
MNNTRSYMDLGKKMLSVCLIQTVLCMTSPAQDQFDSHDRRTHSVDESDSRAELEAERLVSLSADKIIALLQEEPGLLLQVKKLLVRKAFEQGRLLDPQDLTDEALYRLIGRDENIRVIVTREIEDRQYVRVKPSREELRREEQLRTAQTAGETAQEEAAVKAGKSQEEAYWSQRDKEMLDAAPPGGSSAQPTAPPAPPQGPLNPSTDQRRAIELAQAQTYEGDYATGLPMDVFGMQRINPDQLSALLSQSSSGLPLGTASQLELASASAPGAVAGLTGGAPLTPFGGVAPGEFPQSTQAQQAQQASLVTPRRTSLPSIPQRPVLKHRPNPYADVPSLYDLYSQYSGGTRMLERFGMDVFQNGTGNFDQLPMDVPAGPDYVLGPGDGLSIDLWGGVSQRLRRMVDREGRLPLPEVGSIEVAGRSLGDVQHLVQTALRSQFRNVEADVSLARLRTVRVYVVGDVRSPGAYDVSSLSTPLNALYVAGGPTSAGSLRILKHFRGKQLVEQADVYDLLLHGIRGSSLRLEAGDTVLVPPLGAEVTVEGMVRRPAVYELNGETNLAQVLELAGGVLPSGTLRHVDVERVEAHETRTMLALDIPENNGQDGVRNALENFAIRDGDKVKISPIVAFADKTVYVDGHVFRPGKYAFRDGMKITDLIKSYQDVLPEPYKPHAEIIRLQPPTYIPEVLAFNLDDALAGKEQDLPLRPFDTVRIFGRYDFEDPPVITVTGSVRDPGDHVTNGATRLCDAIFLAGNTTPDAELDDVQVFRKTDGGKLKVLSVNLSKALAGDSSANILLQLKDRVFVHKNLARTDPPNVAIEGEVAHPGKYPLGEGMSAADLVRLAGGLKRSAYTEEADLTNYTVERGEKVVGDHQTVAIAAALAGEPDTDVRLRDGDVLSIRQLTGWNDVGATITVKGEVLYPGTYGINEGERLSSIIERAGGLRSDAYAYGAIFERVQVRDLEEKNRSQLIRQVQDEGAGLKTVDDPLSKESAVLQWKNTLEKLQNTPPQGRVVIHISRNVDKWANTPNDIQVRAGDVLYIPKRPNFVMVDGAVYNPTAVTFKPNKSAEWYLKQSGGPTIMANKKAIFVVRADGTVVGGKGGMFVGGATEAAIQPGDMVVVPDKAFGGGISWRNTLQVAQLVSAVGIAVQVARGF